ncbi:hypothetical protein JCM9279_003967 [Rhodotorula babjevae]
MSARARSARKSTASTFSYAEPASSADEDEGSELDDQDRGGGGRHRKIKAPAKRRESKAKAADVDSGDEGDEDDQPRKKPRGSAKGKQSKQKKGTGKLEILKTLPIEMLTEIFSHLYPNDLLALSMVNKQYRALLTAKSSTRLWKAARDQLKLPDVVTEHFSEIQYATLIFGRNCQLCNVGKYVSVEPRLRVRHCKSCRTQEIVKLKSLKRTHPDVLAELHPRAKDAVIQSGSQILLGDLYRATVILRELEVQDEDSDIAEGNPPPASAPSSASLSSRRRSSRKFYSKEWTSRQDVSDDEDDSVSPFTRRVNEYIVTRSGLFEEISKHALDIKKASEKAKEHLQHAKWHDPGRPAVASNPDREKALEQKILGLGLGYSMYDLYYGPYQRSKLVTSPDPLTDEEWVRIKPKLLKLLDRRKELHVKQGLIRQQRNRQYDRQRILRPLYDKLLKSLDESARPFAPLFLDFLLLPSVKALWSGDDDVTEHAWTGAVEDIKEDLEQFRLDLVVHARTLILEATADPDERSTAEDDHGLGEDDLDLDAFFSLVTSLVCCGERECAGYSRRERRRWFHTRNGFEAREPKYIGSVGPLARVLEHIHKHHNGSHRTLEVRDFQASPSFRLKVPLEVVCATSALLEVNQLDPATTSVTELMRAERMVQCYSWENRRSGRRTFWSGDSGFELLYAIRSEGDKLSRMKPPVYLDPPIIVMHPRSSPYPANSDTADAKRKDNAGVSSASKSKAGFHVFGDSEDDEDMSGDSEDW